MENTAVPGRHWFYVEQAEQRGPTSEADMANLIKTGRINGRTQVWSDGMPAWAPVSETALADLLSVAPAGPPPISNQGYSIPSGKTLSNGSDLGLWGYFKQAITEKYAKLDGRARRKEYWGFCLFVALFLFGGTLLITAIGAAMSSGRGSTQAPGILGLLLIPVVLAYLGIVIPWIAITVRRLHDIGLSGWFVLLHLIPYVGSLVVFVMTVLPSKTDHNQYGPVPAGVQIA